MFTVIESLEPRRLLAAISPPAAVLNAYDALLLDGRRLQADVVAARKALARDQRTLTVDVNALGKTPANSQLLRQAKSAGAASVATLSAATSRYVEAAMPVYRRLAVASTQFAFGRSTGNAKRLLAAQAKVRAVAGKQYVALVAAVTNGTAGPASARAALGSANPDAAQLTADLDAVANDQSALSTAQNAHLSTTSADINRYLSVT